MSTPASCCLQADWLATLPCLICLGWVIPSPPLTPQPWGEIVSTDSPRIGGRGAEEFAPRTFPINRFMHFTPCSAKMNPYELNRFTLLGNRVLSAEKPGKELTVDAQLQDLKDRLATIQDLRAAVALMNWDQDIHMPAGAAQGRAQQMSTLSRLGHEHFTDAAIGRLLEALEPWAADQPYDSDAAALVRKVRRDYDRETKVPSEFVARFAKARSLANSVWPAAKHANDFAKFAPHLEEIFGMTGEYAGYVGYTEHIYDALLDGYEPDMKASQVEAIFTPLREETVKLVRSVRESGRTVDVSALSGDFDHDTQLALATKMVKAFGYDMNRGRVDEVAHPYCTNFGRDDVRITTTVDPKFFNSNFFSMLHECGHALYEQGSAPELEGTSLAGGVSFGIHESQSRLWENLVGRSRPFWAWAYPQVQASFPHLQGVPSETFYRAINVIKPSLIRIEADEVTYNLHIMLRFELEKAILEGKVKIADLPEEWDQRMENYLGVVPPTVGQGVLQDVHWSLGLIGYFPTYSLGNIISVQLYEAAKADHPGLEDEFAQGKFDTVLGWMRQNIHVHGSKFTPNELLMRATGSEIDSAPYVAYLKRKIADIYGV